MTSFDVWSKGWGNGQGSIRTSILITPESVHISWFSKGDPGIESGTEERKEWIHDYSQRHCSAKTHWSKFMKILEETIATSPPTASSSTSSFSSIRPGWSPQHAHTSQLHLWAVLLLCKEVNLVLRKCCFSSMPCPLSTPHLSLLVLKSS